MRLVMVLLAVGVALAAGTMVAPAADGMGCVIGYSSTCTIPIDCVMECCAGPCCYPMDCADP